MSKEKKSKNEDFEYQTVSDIENNKYRTIKINSGILGANQEWFADNLNVSCFRNGDAIMQAQQLTDWVEVCKKGIPAWCYYEDKENFGKLYNLAAILDARGLAPVGYEIPDYYDFSILGFNAQEYKPIETNTFAFNLDVNYRIDNAGLRSGALKIMAKTSWKKNGKNIVGTNFTGAGWRGAFNNILDFTENELKCKIWFKPSGWFFKDFTQNKPVGFGLWIDFHDLKTYLPDLLLEDNVLNEHILLKKPLDFSYNHYEIASNISINNSRYQKGSNLFISAFNRSQFYPINKISSNENKINYDHAVNCLFASNYGGYPRTATFVSGKNQVFYESAESNYGAYVRPFKYL